jgi:glycosyltransferase involved in cell wall biosynthesis
VTAPLVSVCVPTFNGEKYLRLALDSIQEQTFKDYEVVVVDDESSDRTVEIARAYAVADERFRIVQNPQRLGLVANWNRCVELARGEWIKFVFQDDLILPACIEKLLDACRLNQVPIGCCRRTFEFDESVPSHLRAFYPNNDREIEQLFHGREVLSAEQFAKMLLENIGRNFVGEPTAVLLDRRVFEVFGKFNPALILRCDAEFWYRVGCHTGIARVHDTLAVFRVHRQSTSSVAHATRSFKLSVLDHLVLLYEFVSNPMYRPLREAAATHRGPAYLAMELRQEGLKALQAAKQNAAGAESDSYPRVRELEEVLETYPAIRVICSQEAELQQAHQELEVCRQVVTAQRQSLTERNLEAERKDQELARQGERLRIIEERLERVHNHSLYRLYRWVKRAGRREAPDAID